MTDFDIEKDVPMPEHDVYRKRKYPFMKLEVDESFFVEAEDSLKVLNSMKSIVTYYQTNFDMRFVVKRVDGGVRCWRIH